MLNLSLSFLLPAGALPFLIQEVIQSGAYWIPAMLGRAGFHSLSPVPTRVEVFLQAWSVPVGLLLLVPSTVLALRILYLPRRLAQIFGAEAGRVRDAMFGWPHPYLVKTMLAMIALEACWDAARELKLDLGFDHSQWPLIATAGLASLVSQLRERRRLERASGRLAPAACVLGDVAAGVCREQLARAGIRSTTESWTLHAVFPCTVPAGCEVVILVPQARVDEAVRVLKEYLETTGDEGAELGGR